MGKTAKWEDLSMNAIKESAASAKDKAEQHIHEDAEIAYRKATMTTQGVKGARNPKITILVTPENDEFLRMAAPVLGMTVTKLINTLVADYREKNTDFIESIKAQRAKFNM